MSTLSRITTRAKQIYKKGKAGITWIAAIKRASAQVKTKATPKRKKARSVKRRRRVGSVAKGPRPLRPFRTIATISGTRKRKRASLRAKRSNPSSRYRKVVELQLGKACVDYIKADTIKATKAAQKRKTKYSKLLKSL